jgi:hypothetical protein
MMKKILISALLCGLFSSAANAGDAKVSWGKFDDFTDVYAGFEHKDQFRERLAKEFEAVFSAFAKKLPEGYELSIDITDIDLAGDSRPGNWLHGHQVRIMREIYWPRMNFTYSLKNAQQEVLASGKEELRDMDYLRRFRIPSGNTEFEYEEKMLQDWFKKQVFNGTFPSKDVKSLAVSK